MPLIQRQNMYCLCGALLVSLTGSWFLGMGDANPRAKTSSVAEIETVSNQPSFHSGSNASTSSDPGPFESHNRSAQDEHPVFPPPEDLVKDWPKPDFVLFISGELHGYIEPCGCTGLENQKGGLLRRHTAQKLLLNRGWDLVSIDTGNSIRRSGIQANVQMSTVFQSLNRTMKYDAISISHDDLNASATDLAQIMLDNFEGHNPYVGCNLEVLDSSISNKFLVIERGGKKIGVTSVIADEHREKINDNDIKSEALNDGLKKVVPQLQQQKCDLLVLIVDASLEESRDVAKNFPVFDVLVTTGGAGDPTLLPESIVTGDHTTEMIQVGTKGMHVGLVGFFTNPKREIRYERVPMDARFVDSEEVKVTFKGYQDRLKQLYENAANFPDITPRNHPSGYEFIGSESCKECHAKEYDIWKNGVDGKGGPHYRATLDLTDPGERVWVKRNFDPECLSCHVTGWNPQSFYPYKTGYVDLQRDAALHGNGCENCHGPASKHAVAENKQNPAADEVLKKLRKEVRITMKEARMSDEKRCMRCHDLDNSPEFLKPDAFDKYWEKIKH